MPDELSTKDQVDFLQKYIFEMHTMARHQETIRATVLSAILALSSLMLAFTGLQLQTASSTVKQYVLVAGGSCVVMLGACGLIYFLENYRQYLMWMKAASDLRTFVVQMKGTGSIDACDMFYQRAVLDLLKPKKGKSVGIHLRVGYAWMSIYAIIAFFGVALVLAGVFAGDRLFQTK